MWPALFACVISLTGKIKGEQSLDIPTSPPSERNSTAGSSSSPHVPVSIFSVPLPLSISSLFFHCFFFPEYMSAQRCLLNQRLTSYQIIVASKQSMFSFFFFFLLVMGGIVSRYPCCQTFLSCQLPLCFTCCSGRFKTGITFYELLPLK